MALSTIEQVTAVNHSVPQRRTIASAVVWVVALLGAAAGGYYLHQVLASPRTMMHLVDLGTYQIAAQRVTDGVSVYDTRCADTPAVSGSSSTHRSAHCCSYRWWRCAGRGSPGSARSAISPC